MEVKQFVDTAEDIARNYRTEYRLGGIGEHNGNLWYFDCVGLIKSILWGWCGDTNYSRGGAVYESNGVPDVGANKMFSDYCYDKSSDFTKIEVGELVWLDGHIGIYIGNRLVAEATSWKNKVILSDLGMQGQRLSNGQQCYSWTSHGKCQFIDYSKPTYKFKKGDIVTLNGWLHKSKDKNSETIGEYHDYVWTISNIEDGEYPYQLNQVGWCRENYLSPYATNDYKEKYDKEVLNSKDLQKQVDNLQSKIKKAIENLK